MHLSAHTALQLMTATWVQVAAHLVPFLLSPVIHLFPFPCLRHYPEPSGTMGTPSPWGSRPLGDPALTLVRRRVRGGAPFVPFTLAVPGRSPQRAFASHPFQLTRTTLSLQMCCDRCRNAPLEAGVQPMQASPCAQDLRSNVLHIFRRLRFTAMLMSPLSFDAR